MASADLRFDGKVVLITGGSGALGSAYANLFASRGAKVVVNDMSKESADKLVKHIKSNGGEALANYDNVLDGVKIVAQIMSAYGRIDIVINNAGILRDKSFRAMTDAEWHAVHQVHVKGAFAVTRACWPIFRKQKYGRIINTASAAGIYGSFGQANYSAAKFALVTFAKTLAREGVKYNITANTVAPIAASQMTATVMPPEVLENLTPNHVAPVVAWLSHESCKETGSLFEMGAGWCGKVRWEQTQGAVFKTDETFTPSAVQAKWAQICDFTNPLHPNSQDDRDLMSKIKESQASPPNKQGGKVDFKDKVVLVTGGGNGIGRKYCLMYAKLGAKVAVNDFSEKNANAVVEEIKKAGGTAAPIIESVEKGDNVVRLVMEAFGALHVVVNNAGILRDCAFINMTEKQWDECYNIHVNGTYSVAHAAWPIFYKQKYGRILNTASIVGVHGNFGQANYAAAKAAIIGLSRTLALEGKKNNIIVNCLVPTAGTQMTATVWSEEMLKTFDAGFVAPPVGFLTSEANTETGGLYEVSGGWVSKYRYQRTAGHAFPNKKIATIEQIRDKWSVITRFDGKATYPATTQESTSTIMANFGTEEESGDSGSASFDDDADSDLVKKMKAQKAEPVEYSWTQRDLMLYNLGIGATEKDLKYVFEGSDEFKVVPTPVLDCLVRVSPAVQACIDHLKVSMLPNFSPMMLLHGEQYLAIKGEIPTEGTIINKVSLADVVDKGKAAAVTSHCECVNKDTGDVLFETYSTTFIRGAGGFGGKRTATERGNVTALNTPPKRAPDFEASVKTDPRSAAIYRLSGDYNPLHVDPEFAAVGGFKQPILHGLCTLGHAGKLLFDKFGAFKDIKNRFSGHLFPGETIVVQAWKEGDKVVFVAQCKERNTTILSNAAITLA